MREGGRVGGWEKRREKNKEKRKEGGRKEGERRSERGREKGVLGMSVYVCIGYECVFGRSIVYACRRIMYTTVQACIHVLGMSIV